MLHSRRSAVSAAKFSTSIVYNGNSSAKRILSVLKKDIENFSSKLSLPRLPGLGIIFVGNNPASLSYIKKKQEACRIIGIRHELYHFSEHVSEMDIFNLIKHLNQRDDIDGIMAQLPLPPHFDKQSILDMICPSKDSDCLKSDVNSLNPFQTLLPCTPAACLHILREHNVDVNNKHVVIIGRGQLVGLPLESLIQKLSPASITTCVKETPNIKLHIQKADVIIAAAGQRQLIKGKWIKKGAVVLDVGVNNGIPGVDPHRIVGDVEFEEARKSASLITPVPGGIGPMTVSMLMSNTVEIWKNRNAHLLAQHKDTAIVKSNPIITSSNLALENEAFDYNAAFAGDYTSSNSPFNYHLCI